MPTEEKIKLYNELNPTGKKFPVSKKPDEKPEDMEWLDKKLAEFGAFDKVEDEPELEAWEVNPEPTPEPTPVVEETPKATKVSISSDIKIYTADELNHMTFDEHRAALKEIAEWRAKAVYR